MALVMDLKPLEKEAAMRRLALRWASP